MGVGLAAEAGGTTVTVPRDYDADPERFLSSTGWPHDDVHPYVAARSPATKG